MITFTKLENEEDILEVDLDRFAASFDHSISRLFPIWTAHLDGELVSYCHVRKQALAYPAVHPSIRPRAAYDLCWRWVTKLKVEHGDPLMLMPEHYPVKLCYKLGLRPLRGRFYSISD